MGRPRNPDTIAVGRVNVNPVNGDRWKLRWEDQHGRQREHSRSGRDEAIAEAGRIDAELTALGVPPKNGGAMSAAGSSPATNPRRPARKPAVRSLGAEDLLVDVVTAAIDPTARPSWGRRHSDRLSSLARCHLIPAIGNVPVRDLRPGDWARVLTDMQNAGYQGSTVKGVFDLMRLVITWGRHNRVWDTWEDPLHGVSLPKASAVGVKERTGKISKVHVPSQALCEALYEALATRPRWQLAARLSAKTGIRLGELLAIGGPGPCNRFDRERRELAIDWQWSQYDDGTKELTLPKHDKRRIVVVPESIADELAEALKEHGRLVADRKGGVPSRSNVSRRIMRPAMDAAGWPRELTWHSLRHRAAVDMVNSLHIADASAMLGHSNPSFTLARYVGIDDDHLGRIRESDW